MSKSTALKIDNGISAKDRKKLADGRAALLADTYTLYLKTHNFHWNVTGPMFNSLHTMFMTQYTDLWTSLDEIAERIRALDHFAPGSGAQFAALSSVLSSSLTYRYTLLPAAPPFILRVRTIRY